MRFVKGHGTENDFVILPDPDGGLELTPSAVAALCDRRTGIGGDGVLRVVRAKVAGDPVAEALAGEAEWFMDYRNSDGSVAEMCGNGVRVFARYLVDFGLAAPGRWDLATRAGLRRVSVGADGDVSVDMGPPILQGGTSAEVAGRSYAGRRIWMGNPHLACRIDGPIEGLDLTRAPALDPADLPHGANVEFFRVRGDRRVQMRVHERGAGETRSCGTGAVAAAFAAAVESGEVDPSGGAEATPAGSSPRGEWRVDVPGGHVIVEFDGTTSHLRGPAVLVAEGGLLPGPLADLLGV